MRRKRRARAHLDRVRGREQGESHRPPPPPSAIVAATVVSLLVGLLFGSPIVAAARGLLGGEPARLSRVTVVGASQLTSREIAAATDLRPGTPLGEIDALAVERRLRAHPWIREARALPLPSGRLLVRVDERVAKAVALRGPDDAEAFAIAADGSVFAPVATGAHASLPRIRSDAPFEPGTVSEAMAGAIALAYSLPERELPLPSVIWVSAEGNPRGYAVALPALAPRVVLGRGAFDERLDRLVELMAADLPELRDSDELDLRFADQAILRGGTPPQGATQAATTRGRAGSSEARPTG